jgi:acyl-CoA synthetase (AMP-forming)/AMP-acid ligase II
MNGGGIGPDEIGAMADSHPGAAAWHNLADGSDLDFHTWDTQSNRLARGLAEDGLGQGERVVIAIGPEEPFPWLIAYAAVHRANAIAVPVNTRLAGPELHAILAHAEPTVILASSGAGGGVPWSDLVGEVARLRVATTTERGGGSIDWSELFHHDGSALSRRPDADRSRDPMDIMYTSGTTGTPKAVVVRYGPRQVGRRPEWNGLGFVTASPFSTTSGALLIYGPMSAGLSGLYLPHFDAGQWLSVIEDRRPVASFIVPAMAQLIVAHPRFAEADLSSLAALTIGGAPVARATLKRLGERLPQADVLVGYGLTEFGAVTRSPSGDKGAHLGSAGRPLPGIEVRIVDGHGDEVPRGQVGEITARGTEPHREYYREPAATRQTWQDGWLVSGDLGYLDDDGFLWVTGRTKDLIIRGGHNIAPGEVEEALFAHTAVVEAVVAGIPHDVLGEDVGAWVVLQDGSDITAAHLRDFLLERLADYKVPRNLHIVSSLPRNAAGKVIKRELGIAPSSDPAARSLGAQYPRPGAGRGSSPPADRGVPPPRDSR